MDDDEYIPHDVVFKILLCLDAKPLMRFACVCKAWHRTITGDRWFHREHHRIQEPQVLIAPRIRIRSSSVDASLRTGLYRWERKIIKQGAFAASTLLQSLDSLFPAVEEERRHALAHCRGLVLVAAADGGPVRVLNPATRRVFTLPPSTSTSTHGGVAEEPAMFFHEAFGLGHDPGTDTYKVVRSFLQSTGDDVNGYRYRLGLDVFTIGRDQQWRRTQASPQYPVIPGRTATFFKGSLLWPIDESYHRLDGDMALESVRGFLRFNLEDESLGIMPAPPGCPDVESFTSNLVEVHGELCLAHEKRPKLQGQYLPRQRRPYSGLALMWSSTDIDPPRWVRRHVVDAPLPIHMIAAAFDDDGGILFQGRSGTLEECCSESDSQSTQAAAARRVTTSMYELKYHHPGTKKLVEYKRKAVHGYDVISYVPNLVSI